MLRGLELERLLHVTRVDVNVNRRNELMDFYDYLRRHWGGERRVPVLRIGREVYMVPRHYSLAGTEAEVENWEELDKQVLALEQMIREDLKDARPEPEPFPTHELMRGRVIVG